MVVQPSGYKCVEMVMCWKYMEVTKDIKKRVEEEGEGILVLFGGESDTEGLDEAVQELFPLQRKRDRRGAQVDQ